MAGGIATTASSRLGGECVRTSSVTPCQTAELLCMPPVRNCLIECTCCLQCVTYLQCLMLIVPGGWYTTLQHIASPLLVYSQRTVGASAQYKSHIGSTIPPMAHF
eukprot:GHUV01033168.1.p2 GENE.GHUV01033168.1~~GHUV01033168.1.p2  ORF type:complete len:105 (+),score=9.59 GHUV01033168.1:83-397(+)